MGLKAKRPCLTCGTLSEGSYCDEHGKEAENTRSEERERTEPHRRFYRDKKWKRARAHALARDGHRCQAFIGGVQCDRENDLTVHHIQPLRNGGEPFELWNLVTLCRPHHEQLENQLL